MSDEEFILISFLKFNMNKFTEGTGRKIKTAKKTDLRAFQYGNFFFFFFYFVLK